MFIKNFTDKTLKLSVFVVVLLITMQCATKSAPATDLPDNILGIKLGMTEQESKSRLEKVGEFVRADGQGSEQVWTINKDPRFSSLAIGFDKEKRVRYVTAFAQNTKERVRYSEVGDLSKAKKEVTKPHHRYTWTVEAADGKPARIISIYGADPEFLSMYSLAEMPKAEKEKEKD